MKYIYITIHITITSTACKNLKCEAVAIMFRMSMNSYSEQETPHGDCVERERMKPHPTAKTECQVRNNLLPAVLHFLHLRFSQCKQRS